MKKLLALLLTLILAMALCVGAVAEEAAEEVKTIAYCTREPADDAGQNMLEQGIRSVIDANPDFELWMLTVDTINDVSRAGQHHRGKRSPRAWTPSSSTPMTAPPAWRHQDRYGQRHPGRGRGRPSGRWL